MAQTSGQNKKNSKQVQSCYRFPKKEIHILTYVDTYMWMENFLYQGTTY